ncbi:MAG: carboxypeptidase-like regulatory domain-containing protein [Ignavibacteriales bacterium]|nr:carboxypeptidase-like regulatory domain-containing protein [Ignavibacteriales bacterium]
MKQCHILVFLLVQFLLDGCGSATAPVHVSYQPAALNGKARLTGTVTDAATKEAVWAVVVSIEGTNLVSGADYNGRYYIDNVPFGKQIVKAQVIGSSAAVSKEIDVKPNQVVNVDFRVETREKAKKN